MQRRGRMENDIVNIIMNMINWYYYNYNYMPPVNNTVWLLSVRIPKDGKKITLVMREFDFVPTLLGSEWYLP